MFNLFVRSLWNRRGTAFLTIFSISISVTLLIGVENIGIGSDLCQNQSDNIVEWMRNGTWTNEKDFGEGAKKMSGFPEQPNWFKSNMDFVKIKGGLSKIGFNENEVELIMGLNWFKFFKKSFGKEDK